MKITADCHLHSSHSGDSDASMEEMILRGIRQGLEHMCFTEHNDFDYLSQDGTPDNTFLLDTGSYLQEFNYCKEKYQEKIRLLFGVELGLQPQIAEKNTDYAKSFDFDFIIGSSHVCHEKDPYYPSFFAGRREEDAYGEYFSSILENIRAFSDFDVYGHLDYVVRYGPNRDRNYSCEKYREIWDEILLLLIEKGKGIEINTGGVRKGLLDLHPCRGILNRYRELGGEIVTIGSDAHEPSAIADSFPMAEEALKACGFRYYTVFEKRRPRFYKL